MPPNPMAKLKEGDRGPCIPQNAILCSYQSEKPPSFSSEDQNRTDFFIS